jgi:hypothetical protein
MLKPDEVHDKQVYSKIYIGRTSELWIGEIEEIIDNYAKYDKTALRELLLKLANQRQEAPSVMQSTVVPLISVPS